MTGNPVPSMDRQTLLASIPEEWQSKFEEELSRSPMLSLVASQVSQHLLETYRQRLELAIQNQEADRRKFQSPYFQIKGKGSKTTVAMTRVAKTRHKSSSMIEEQIEQILKAQNFWGSSTSYMWFDLTKMAVTEMERDTDSSTLDITTAEERLTMLYRYIFDEVSDSLKSNFLKILEVYIEKAVQVILNHYDLPAKTLQELQWLVETESKPVSKASTTAPNIFANGVSGNFATCKLLWEAMNIITQREDLEWHPDGDGKLAYTSTIKDGRGKLIFWVTDDPEEQYPEALAGEAALAVIETFDIRAACMHLIYAAHVTALDRPWEEEFVIDDRQIASYLGLDKRKDVTKEERLKLIEKIAEQPSQILTFLQWTQQGSIESFYVEKSRLWDVAIGYHGQRDLFGNTRCTGLTIRCRAGMWAKYFLNKRGADEGSAFYQYGVLSKKLLQTITRVWQHSEGAARILAWLSFKMRVSSTHVMLTPTLMEVAYGVDKVAAAQCDRDLRSDLANRWDNDLRVLTDAGLTIEFDAATYPPEIQPDWYEGGRGTKKRPKGFWEQLRSSRIQIHPPKEIAEGLAKLQRRKKTIDTTATSVTSLPKFPASALDGAQVRTARERKGWSQEELAQRLNKTRMWVSYIERNQRKAKPEDAGQIRQLLEIRD
jgi:DNA-binding transcriptional regulator YiaG